MPKADTRVTNFNQMRELFLSKDLSRLEELKWIDEGAYNFLDGKVNMEGNRVALASFPRSGNSFLRRFLEQITGVTTGGGDYAIDIPLLCNGLTGEGHSADDSIWVSKSHHPLRFK